MAERRLAAGFRRDFWGKAECNSALVCLAGVVNYGDERNPTEAMTPTVAKIRPRPQGAGRKNRKRTLGRRNTNE